MVTTVTDHDTCSISVHNQGEPIPEAARANLFQPMVRGSEVGTEARSVGLGLYIVAEVARAHDGEVRLARSTEAGTEFVAVFPRDLGAKRPAASQASTSAERSLP